MTVSSSSQSRETLLSENEQLVSTTDLKGVITYRALLRLDELDFWVKGRVSF
ncbi:hypothetical protein VCRA2120E57_680001 [Vibrio crassostreae]|nr:hypothetical protein VCRA2120E57_680001 [Vibrio crassostreae]